ncbi:MULTISPECIES: CoA ester lyase [unclassified Sphingomonas]|uniref:HpcH/HpaI aldolase/citrate lyase family protein n=1 Tax=unclassified Sphingomonas TaxID=196159 RepID=UPI000BD61688|nr:MAG: CoA ester lyase [Sphingomonas sp. 12-62-6]OYX39672.1 MAG: CoA ester lyase [Sphingomonas sp. 32-62-10]
MRSALYLPASNERAIAKARTLPCDAVILDLEDAVAPEMKATARSAAVAAFGAGGFGQRSTVLRVNAIDTEWGLDDLLAAVTLDIGAVLVPKVNGPDDIARYNAALDLARPGVQLWVMIETCLAVGQLQAIADCAPHTRLGGFVMGTNDLALEMRSKMAPDRATLLPILTLALAAARSRRLIALDGVCNEFSDLDRFTAEAEQGLVLGFDGKTLIHPAQIDPCNAVFSPTPDEIAKARSISAAFALPENAGKGAIRLDGRMVERLHLVEAERLLAMVAAIG